MSTKIILFASLFITGIMFSACQSTADKKQAATEKVSDAVSNQQVVNTKATADSLESVVAAEWSIFKRTAETNIKNNDDQLMLLKKTAPANSPMATKSIDSLVKRNDALKTMINNYSNHPDNWQVFKDDFNNSMIQLQDRMKQIKPTKK